MTVFFIIIPETKMNLGPDTLWIFCVPEFLIEATKRIYLETYSPVVHRAMDYDQKSFKLVWRGLQLLSGFLPKYHLPRVSRQSRLSTNDKVEMIPEAVHRSPGIYLTIK